MNSEFITSDTIVLTASAIGFISVLIALSAARQVRLIKARCDRMEESLRAFSSANSGVGRRVSHLDTSVQQLRIRLMNIDGSGVAKPQPVVQKAPSAVSASGTVASMFQSDGEREASGSASEVTPFDDVFASRVGAAFDAPSKTAATATESADADIKASDDHEEFSEAELQLAQLLKQRMSSMRAVAGG